MLSYQTSATFPSLFYPHTLCYFTNVCRLIKLSSSYQPFVIFSPFVIYSLFYVIYASYKCTCCTHHKHKSLSCLIVHTLSTPIYLPNSPSVFGHRAILMWGDRGMAGFFFEEQPVTLQAIVKVFTDKGSRCLLCGRSTLIGD